MILSNDAILTILRAIARRFLSLSHIIGPLSASFRRYLPPDKRVARAFLPEISIVRTVRGNQPAGRGEVAHSPSPERALSANTRARDADITDQRVRARL